MKKLTAILLSALMVLSLCSFTAIADADYSISNWSELTAWAASSDTYSGKTVVLTADITAPSIASWTTKASFYGTLDGQGHTISGLRGTTGLIGDLYGTVKNLSIKDSQFLYTSTTNAAVARTAKGGSLIENVYSDAKITGTNHIGGIAGLVGESTAENPATIIGCWFDGEVAATATYASGILGNQNHGHAVITDCLNTGKVSGTGHTGGISASVYTGSLVATRCVNLGPIYVNSARSGWGVVRTITYNSTTKVGGAITLSDCYNLEGMAQTVSDNIVSNGTFNGGVVNEIESPDELLDYFAPFAETWGRNSDGLLVPAAFADSETDSWILVEGISDAVVDQFVSLDVKIAGNPGVTNMRVKLDYDHSALQLLSVDNGDFFDDAAWIPGNISGDSYYLVYENEGLEDVTAESGILATLNFKVISGAVSGEDYTVSATFASGDANNAAGEDVDFAVKSGVVSISTYNVIRVGTYAELEGLSSTVNACNVVLLTADIVANAGTAAAHKANASGLSAWTPKTFYGIFNGNGYSISGLYLNGSSKAFFGTFRGTIKNVQFTEAYVATTGGSAVVAAGNSGSKFQAPHYKNVYVSGIIDGSGNNNAGFQSQNAATFKDCWFDGDLTATNRYCSGFVANSQSSTVITVDCLSTGTIRTNATGYDRSAFDNAVYSGFYFARRSVNAGIVEGTGSADAFIWYNSAGASHVSVADSYSVSGYANRTSYASNITGLNDLSNADMYPAYADTWAMRADGIFAPAYFRNFDGRNPEVILISNVDELKAWAADVSANVGVTVRLTADITLNAGTAAAHQASGTGLDAWTPKAYFAGTFDGQGHSISGLYINGGSGIGFIKYLAGTVENVRFLEPCLIGSGGHYVGVVAAFSKGGTIRNTYVDGIASSTGADVSGFIGDSGSGAYPTTIESCWFNGSVSTSNGYSAAFVGNQESSLYVITDCLNTGTVTSTGTNIIGGISPAVYTGSLDATRCVNAGKITNSETRKNDACAITTTITSNASKSGHATLTDCYSLRNTCVHANPNDFRQTKSQSSGAPFQMGEFEGYVEEITSLEALLNDPAYSGWVKISDGLVVPAAFADLSVTFTPQYIDVIEIGTYDQLVSWAQSGNTTGVLVRLTADIVANTGDASTWVDNAPSKMWTTIDTFTGTFDGQGHTISGLYSEGRGFISYAPNSEIKNLAIVNSCFVSDPSATRSVNISSVSSVVYCTLIRNVYSDAIVINNGVINAETGAVEGGNSSGGIVGDMQGAVILDNVWFDGELSIVGSYGSGLIGNQESGFARITDSLNTGLIDVYNMGSGISNAVYQGVLKTERVINAGQIEFRYGNPSSAVVDILSAVYSYDSTAQKVLNNGCGGVLELSDTYTVAGTAGVVGVRNRRTAGVTCSYITGEIVEIASMDELESNDAFSGWSLNPNGILVPTTFSDFALNEHVYDRPVITISNEEELVEWASSLMPNELVLLTDDIEVTGTWKAKSTFTGVFDGQGHTISFGSASVGLINNFWAGEIRNLSIVDTTITSNAARGAFANTARGKSLFVNCYTDAVISGMADGAGGFVGNILNDNGEAAGKSLGSVARFEGCWSAADVTITNRYASGFVGNSNFQRTVFVDCLFTGTVDASAYNEPIDPEDPTPPVISGFAGATYDGTSDCTNCLFDGTLLLSSVWANIAGGAFNYRAYCPEQEIYVNNYAVSGTANHLRNEDEAYDAVVAGEIEWVAADQLGHFASILGDNWSYRFTFAGGAPTLTPVPVAFQNAQFSHIYFEEEPSVLEYELGDELDLDGLEVVAVYDVLFEGETETEEVEFYLDLEDLTVTGFDSETAGEKEVTVTYDGKYETFVVVVIGEDFTYGDLNDDTLIDTRDLTLLRQYLADPTTEVNLSAADANGDGPINTLDLTLLRQRLADGTVQLGPAANA